MREKLTLSQFKSKIDSARCSFSLKSSTKEVIECATIRTD
jgi:hypothetical protein